MHYFSSWLKYATRVWFFVPLWMLIILSYDYADIRVAEYAQHLQTTFFFKYLKIYAYYGQIELYLASGLVLTLFFRYIIRRKSLELKLWFLWSCIAYSAVICGVMKVCLGRARPELWFSSKVYGFYGWHLQSAYHSCPSGHTTAMVSLLLGLTILLPRYLIIWLLWAVTQLALRVILVQHYLSDVIISAYLVMIGLGLYFIFLRWVRRQHWISPELQQFCAIVE